jgi:hypothetical protein
MGTVAFQELYLTPEAVNRALARQQDDSNSDANNRYANSKQGIHAVRGPLCNYDHRVSIMWREVDEHIDVPGWYYRDLDGDTPERWLRPWNKPESCRTSASCFAAMINDIADKLE